MNTEQIAMTNKKIAQARSILMAVMSDDVRGHHDLKLERADVLTLLETAENLLADASVLTTQ